MANDKFIMMDMDDERSKLVAEILGNATAKKILGYLAEVKDASEKDISDKLGIPINTVEYNLNKLIKAELIEKTSNFFWSVKGKRIPMYKLSNKKIIISPRTFSKGVIPSIFAVILGSFAIKFFSDKMNYNEINRNAFNGAIEASKSVGDKVFYAPGASEVSSNANEVSQFILNSCSGLGDIWLWFLLGGLFGILVFLIWNSFKNKVKGGF